MKITTDSKPKKKRKRQIPALLSLDTWILGKFTREIHHCWPSDSQVWWDQQKDHWKTWEGGWDGRRLLQVCWVLYQQKAEHGHGIPAPVNISLGKSETRKCMWRSLISAPGHRDFITMLFQAHGRTTVLSWLLWLVWVNLKLLSLRIAYILGLYT
jgi:hypothetical protein